MCGRYTLTSSEFEIKERFAVRSLPSGTTSRYNIAPSQQVAVLVHVPEPTVVKLRWGLIPPWAENATVGARMINARAEGVENKRSFGRAVRRRRCLVLADGFYEWRRLEKTKVPYYIHFKSERPFGFAGLWERWSGPGGERVHSCTIITTRANTLISGIHHRMPVILDGETRRAWLDPQTNDVTQILPLLCPYRSEEMVAYPVSPEVNSPGNDSERCIRPV